MKRIDKLYHGSNKRIKGDRLRPIYPKDISGRQWNSYRAVYATNIKDIAITFALIKSEGVVSSGLNFRAKDKPFGIIYEGWPNQEEIYIYHILEGKFIQDPHIDEQWYSRKSIRPSKIEVLKTDDHTPFIRKATDEELALFLTNK